MDWLRNIVSNLPLDDISEAASRLTIWWSNFVADVPPDMLPMYAYIGFSIVVLLLWLFVVKVLPSPIGGMSWLAVFSVLMAPGSAAGDSGDIAPASIGVIYGILMKEPGMAMRSLLPILVVFSVGLVLGFIWQMIRSVIESNSDRMREQERLEEQRQLELASANYAQIVQEVDGEKVETNTKSKGLFKSLKSEATKLSNKARKQPAKPAEKQDEMLAKPADRTVDSKPVKQPEPTVKTAEKPIEKTVTKPTKGPNDKPKS
ncbi:hypothetical protein [Psychrobacter sp. FDAARGOS_221]|uniref:hypothetical protein n=1 Tax=Psychrobacter sp. FDAARGOS_221 TaxID=1975705 RepID=UPI001D0D098B|nr:hypothetical protein [Psychrobacter sp. FDAARGOS_221]